MKRILEESNFHSSRIEMIKRLIRLYTIRSEFIEYALGKEKKTYFYSANDTTKLFEAISPTLPQLHIVTLYWRIAKETLNIKDVVRDSILKGHKKKRTSLNLFLLTSVSRLNQLNQRGFVIWFPNEQSDEKFIDVCFNQLERVQKTVMSIMIPI